MKIQNIKFSKKNFHFFVLSINFFLFRFQALAAFVASTCVNPETKRFYVEGKIGELEGRKIVEESMLRLFSGKVDHMLARSDLPESVRQVLENKKSGPSVSSGTFMCQQLQANYDSAFVDLERDFSNKTSDKLSHEQQMTNDIINGIHGVSDADFEGQAQLYRKIFKLLCVQVFLKTIAKKNQKFKKLLQKEKKKIVAAFLEVFFFQN